MAMSRLAAQLQEAGQLMDTIGGKMDDLNRRKRELLEVPDSPQRSGPADRGGRRPFQQRFLPSGTILGPNGAPVRSATVSTGERLTSSMGEPGGGGGGGRSMSSMGNREGNEGKTLVSLDEIGKALARAGLRGKASDYSEQYLKTLVEEMRRLRESATGTQLMMRTGGGA